MTDTVLIFVLLAGGLALILAEVCTPSFGLLAAAAMACFGVMLYKCFAISSALGIGVTVALLVGLPMYLSVLVRLFPKTPLGKRLTLRAVTGVDGSGVPQSKELNELLGAEGTTLTALRPSGTVVLGDQRLTAMAENDMIPAGTPVRVIKVSGMTLVVRAK
jgi:membrane-bound serine protease (ClpP class)